MHNQVQSPAQAGLVMGQGKERTLLDRPATQLERLRQALVNRPESKSFFATAVAWRGSVSPRVLGRVLVTTLYAVVAHLITSHIPHIAFPITPFEYSGAVLALILVLRVNSGHDRWWEGRKLWGAIVNQSRNLALVVKAYTDSKNETSQTLLQWIAVWPYAMRDSLRNDRDLDGVEALIGPDETRRLRESPHMPMYVAFKIASLLQSLKQSGLDSFVFLRAETERSQLIDAIGACERIRNTRMPLVLAIKTRRFITMFLLLLPFALVDRLGWFNPLVVALASYPLFCLDEIGAELQNPFSARNLSHLPLDEICRNIAKNILDLKNM